MEKPYKNFRKQQFSDSCKTDSLAGCIDPNIQPKILHLGISFDAESEFGIHFVSGSMVTTSLVLMSRTDFENGSFHFYPYTPYRRRNPRGMQMSKNGICNRKSEWCLEKLKQKLLGVIKVSGEVWK